MNWGKRQSKTQKHFGKFWIGLVRWVRIQILNENEELNTDEINVDEFLDIIDNHDIIDILDHISEEEILFAVKNLNNGKAPVKIILLTSI